MDQLLFSSAEGLPVLAILSMVLKIWMVVDAFQSGNERLWFLIVFLPFGEWVYFFLVKIHDPNLKRRIVKFTGFGKPSIESLKRAAEYSPSIRNREIYAAALFDAEKYQEACSEYEAIVRSTSDSKEVLFKIALCKKKLGQFEEAREILEKIVSANPKFQDYRASLELAELERQQGETLKAVELLQKLPDIASRLDLRLELARALLAKSENGDAKLEINPTKLLEDVMADFKSSPSFYRRKNGTLYRQAKKLRKSSLSAVPA